MVPSDHCLLAGSFNRSTYVFCTALCMCIKQVFSEWQKSGFLWRINGCLPPAVLLTYGIISPDSLAPAETTSPVRRPTLRVSSKSQPAAHSMFLCSRLAEFSPEPALLPLGRSLVPGTRTRVFPGSRGVGETIATNRIPLAVSHLWWGLGTVLPLRAA